MLDDDEAVCSLPDPLQSSVELNLINYPVTHKAEVNSLYSVEQFIECLRFTFYCKNNIIEAAPNIPCLLLSHCDLREGSVLHELFFLS